MVEHEDKLDSPQDAAEPTPEVTASPVTPAVTEAPSDLPVAAAELPPAEEPSAEEPPAEEPSAEEPSAEEPPAEEPPVEDAAPDQGQPVMEDEPATEEQDEPGAPRSRKRWYVIHTYSGHENKVKANLERAIQYAQVQDKFGEILVATEDYAVMKAGKKQITKRKTFPSYVLVEMDMSDDARAIVQNIPGVTHFVGDRSPTPLTEAEVRRIRGEEVREVGKVTTEVPFKVGESVKVTEGPFADFVGSVDEIYLDRGKLRVMVSIFGRPTAVELDLTHVTSI